MKRPPNEPNLPVLDRIARVVDDLRSDGVGSRWVVAVSGGRDSVGLLLALDAVRNRSGLELSVAHLDHGLRGAEGEADAAFVADLAERLGLPFDLGRWSPERTHHIEADARRARYEWLERVARDRDASAVAVAHTRDDQAETILHRILRGTGPDGLQGMTLCRPLVPGISLVRPALGVRRSDLADYVEGLGQHFRTDASNTDLGRTRNRVRLDLLPKLQADYNPEVVEAVARLGDLMRESVADRESELRAAEGRAIVEESPDRVEFLVAALRGLTTTTRIEVVRRAWRRLGLPEREMNAGRWRRVAEFAERTQGRLDLPGRLRMTISDDRLTLSRVPNEPNSSAEVQAPVELNPVGPTTWGGWTIDLTPDPATGCAETIDTDRLVGPLRVGPPRPGDRFAPLGMGGKSMPLADFLRGRGVGKAKRSQTPIVRDGEGIVWVVGHRIAHRVRVDEETRRRLGLDASRQDRESGEAGGIGGCD